MEDKTCQNCNGCFYTDITRCASCYELSNWESKDDDKQNDNYLN